MPESSSTRTSRIWHAAARWTTKQSEHRTDARCPKVGAAGLTKTPGNLAGVAYCPKVSGSIARHDPQPRAPPNFARRLQQLLFALCTLLRMVEENTENCESSQGGNPCNGEPPLVLELLALPAA